MVRPFRRFYQKWLNTIEKLHAPIAGGSTNIVPGISTNRHPPSIEKLRGVTVEKLQALVARHTERRQFGMLGEPRVNVLELNLDLDQRFPVNKQARGDHP